MKAISAGELEQKATTQQVKALAEEERKARIEADAERERALQAEVRALDQSKRRDAEEGQTTQQAKSEIQAAEKRARGADRGLWPSSENTL